MTAAVGASTESSDKSSIPVFGRYQTIVKLGSGGMADVYLAAARGPSGFRKLLVLKTLHKHLSQDKEFVDMFMHEAKLAARLNHPNVVQTNDVSRDGDLYVLSMEFLEGASLAGIRARSTKLGRPLPVDLQLRILLDALLGLHHAHELTDFDGTPLNLVHRDVTPNNILVTYAGQVKVLDFGIAKSAFTTAQTNTGILKGTVRYLSPEAVQGKPFDRRSDIFSVGVMLWEAISGKRMWKGLSDVTILQKIASGELPPLERGATSPEAFDTIAAICAKALAVDREGRYATALELHEALEDYLSQNSKVRGRQLGDLVSSLFEEQRRELQQIIDAQLMRLDALGKEAETKDNALSVVAFEGFRRLAGSEEDRGSSSTQHRLEANTLTASRRARLGWGALAVVVLAAVGGGLAIRYQSTKAEMAVAKPSEVVPSFNNNSPQALAGVTAGARAADMANDSAALVRVRVTAEPAGAEVFLDGARVPGNPAVIQRPRGHVKATIVVQAAGYDSRNMEVWLDDDTDVVIALDRQVTVRRQGRRVVSPGLPASPTQQAPGASPPKTSQEPASVRQLDKGNPWSD